MGSSIITNKGKLIMLNRTWKATPDYTTMSTFKIGTGTTAPAITDTDIETGVNINGGATKSFVTGFTTLDETNFQATIRCFLNTLEGNGNNLTEMAIFNTDATPKMWSRMTHTSVTKSNSIEITYIQKDKLT